MPGTKESNKIGWATRREKESTRATQEVSGPDICGLSIDELIGLISSPMSEEIDLPCVHRAIELARSIDGIPRQNDVLSACMRKLLRGKSPKKQQVRSLRRLVFRLGDTLLIAKTGKEYYIPCVLNLDWKDHNPVSSIVQVGRGTSRGHKQIPGNWHECLPGVP
jgi:hypothetical protein